MNILHIVAGNVRGGAARGAYWLHQGLIELDIDSNILISGKSDQYDKKVKSLSNTKLEQAITIFRSQFDPLILKLYKNNKGNIFSTGLIGYDFTKSDQYKQADIIHFHWINSGMVNIKHLLKTDKPIVWTLRDMWPMTGGCHYSLECDGFKRNCGTCPQLGSHKKHDLSRLIYNRKLKYIPVNITIVGISNWLTEQARQSSIFKEKKCITIMNNINTDDFKKINKTLAREILGIKTEKKIILCGSTNLKDFYKGFQKYLDALHYLNKDDLFLCFFGNFDKNLMNNYNFDYKSFGYLNDNISLNLVYSAADVFVAPSTQEAFGKTLAEAQCSGTPVVCFNATGPKDIVEHKVTGYLADPFDPKLLAKGIEWVVKSPDHEQLCNNARIKVLRNFDRKIVANDYVELYKEILRK